ncbi:hypothetical protein FOMPIDRAFT_87014 [Fomitopsis schrenkii]|uniref:Uncharacterized protein n=1 Tax=Fomitopsis schrenkii TaxID=2126942 RepID=S8G048_FOMSC|nr:hypothetical protein FOMPIDRAFT_87014 [Fomitopsis schrenkii]
MPPHRNMGWRKPVPKFIPETAPISRLSSTSFKRMSFSQLNKEVPPLPDEFLRKLGGSLNKAKRQGFVLDDHIDPQWVEQFRSHPVSFPTVQEDPSEATFTGGPSFTPYDLYWTRTKRDGTSLTSSNTPQAFPASTLSSTDSASETGASGTQATLSSSNGTANGAAFPTRQPRETDVQNRHMLRAVGRIAHPWGAGSPFVLHSQASPIRARSPPSGWNLKN